MNEWMNESMNNTFRDEWLELHRRKTETENTALNWPGLGMSSCRTEGRCSLHVEGENASVCRISWRSIKPLLRYGDFWISQNGGRRHLGFSIFPNFKGRNGPGWKFVTVLNFVTIGETVAEIWGFCDFPRCRPSAIFDLWCACLGHSRRSFAGLYHCVKCGWNRCTNAPYRANNVIMLGPMVYKKSVTKFLHPSLFWRPRGPLGQSSPVWMVMYEISAQPTDK